MDKREENPAEEQRLTGEAWQIAEEIRRSLANIKQSQTSEKPILAEDETNDIMGDNETTTIMEIMQTVEVEQTEAPDTESASSFKQGTFFAKVFSRTEAAQENKKNTERILTITAAVLVWCALVGGSFGFLWHKLNTDRTALYAMMESEIRNVQESNTLALDEMTAKIQTISTDIEMIKESMANTGAAIDSSSAANREALTEKIDELDKQLASLQQSLKILQEDKNAR